MRPVVRPFESPDLEPAAAMVAARVARLRSAVPELPAALADPAAWTERIAAMAERSFALAADRDGRFAGFLAGERGADASRVFVPEWAWAVDAGDRRALESLYAAAAAAWVADGARAHVVGGLDGRPEEAATLVRLGFGEIVADAVRSLEPTGDAGAAVRIRRATPDDAEVVAALEAGLRRHLAASPVFLVLPPPESLDRHRERLAEPGVAVLLAEDDDGPIAHLRVGPSPGDVAAVVRDPGTASITGAFTLVDRRGVGVATTLLDAALAWAREEGYVRCGVDFETANLEAARFWLRWFRPVVTWRLRRLPPEAGTIPG